MRSIETHKSNGCNEQLTITATDEPGAGGANHRYMIVADRLESFQAGPYACEENSIAHSHVIGALTALNQRTAKRVARGVEGTLEV